MAKALVVYATRTGQTQKIAELIAEGVRFSSHEAELKSAADIKKPEDLAGYDAYVFGSATYHGAMMPTMKQLLFTAETAGLDGKPAGAYGAFGWSGEAPGRILMPMKNIFNMQPVGDSLRLKSALLDGGVQMAQGYGKDVGGMLG